MFKTVIEYCYDGYHDIRVDIDSFIGLQQQLEKIKKETMGIFTAPFSVDVVIDEIGRISIALDETTMLCYKSADLEFQLTAIGDLAAEGYATVYFGDYSIMSKKYLISYNLALDILDFWINTGKLSDQVSWTDKIF